MTTRKRRVTSVRSSTRGDRLRSAREAKGLSQAEAAKALGMPVATYSAHERAQQPGGRDFNPEDARDYARFYGRQLNWLMTGEDNGVVDERLTIATSAQVEALTEKVETLTALVTKLISTK